MSDNWLELIGGWNWIPSGFRYPQILALEAIPIILLFWVWNRSSRGVPLPMDHSPHRRGVSQKAFINLAEMLFPLLLAVAIFILAGPLEFGKPQSKRALSNILFCVDISGSMSAPFGDGDRYDASMKAIDKFLDYRTGDSFGLTFFGNSVLHWTPLTTDASAIRCAVPFMNPRVVPYWFNGTSIGKALLECRSELMKQEEGDRMIILISDGASSDLAGGNDVDIANRLVDAGVTVFAIHIAEGDPPPEVTKICAKTNGEAFATADPYALEAVFHSIDQMKKAEMQKMVAEQKDNFRPYAAIGVLLLVLGLVSSLGLRYTPW
jgi:Ca-activated chloride channel family protein